MHLQFCHTMKYRIICLAKMLTSGASINIHNRDIEAFSLIKFDIET